jgi:hypothetical protein
LHLTRHSPHLFSRLTYTLWQRAGPNSTKHMISLFRRHTWAVYELFWTRKPHCLVIWFNENCLATSVARPLFSIFGYCHYWLCGAWASA